MTDQDAELAGVERAARELIPQLTERLARLGLGELEVREGSVRVRVVASQAAAPGGGGPRIVATRSPVAEASASGQGGHAAHPAHAAHADQHAADATSTTHGVTAPAVGFFAYADGLGPGLAVEKGDALGHVEMLGVRHDVRAPRRGLVRHLVIEAGEPVEYGQVLVELEPSE